MSTDDGVPMNSNAEPAAEAEERIGYRWTIFYVGPEGRRPVESEAGWFGSADPRTGRAYDSYTAVGAAVFDDVCDEVTENYRFAVLDARLDGVAEPVAVTAIAVVVYDSGGTEMANLTGTLYHRPITEEEVADELIAWTRSVLDDERRRLERDLESDTPDPATHSLAGFDTIPAAPEDTLTDEQRRHIRDLRDAAEALRAEVHEPDYCRSHLARAEHDLAAAQTGVPAAESVADPGHADVARQAARVDRWRRLLDIAAEAYIDAAALDAAADHARRAYQQG
ncbi:hypothetical protein [Nocardia sp. BMG51109]|uniref:hypothetical protein n=1 Tax=Nocardia sp. BMG51109 TaxID=1056816 RepID=UPI00046315D3|nr:hypothetical protein [Nocardia sp. BMG51109]